MSKVDMVNMPPHYQGKHPCLDVIKQQLGSGYASYLEGNIIKYIFRHKDKNANIQDLQKGEFYLKELINYYKNL